MRSLCSRLLALLMMVLGVTACGGSRTHQLATGVRILGYGCWGGDPVGRGPASCSITFSDGEHFACSAIPPRRTNQHAAAVAVTSDPKCTREADVRVPPQLGLMTRETTALVACLNRAHLSASGFTSFAGQLAGPLAGQISTSVTYVTIYLTSGVAARSLTKPPDGEARVGRFVLQPNADVKVPRTITRCRAAA
jgi:hypothetical protein